MIGPNVSPVVIDLKNGLVRQDVKDLIASVEDDRHWSLVVTRSRIAYLCELDEAKKRVKSGSVVMQVETFVHGTGWVGVQAATHAKHVSQVMFMLLPHVP